MTLVSTHAGVTIGQLSQAEAGLRSFEQPIVITTLSGIPIPLRSLLAPAAWYVVDDGACHTVPTCSQVHSGQILRLVPERQTRLHGLIAQGPLVAVDEMCFYSGLLRNQGNEVGDPIVLDLQDDTNQQLATWALQCLQANEENSSRTTFMVPTLFASHWSPIALHVQPHSTVMHVPVDLEVSVQRQVVEACGPFEFTFKSFVLPTNFPADCGFQTVSWMFAHAIGTESPKATIPAQADLWRALFARHVIKQEVRVTEAIRLGGAVNPDQLLLQSLLKQHGVHQDRLATCATSLIQQLGADLITKILGSPHPRKDLKTAATQANPPIRIILAAEVDAAVKARLASGKPMGSKANKQASVKGPKLPVIPTAEQIKLPDAIFIQQDGTKMSALPLHKVEAHAQGVALCNIGEVAHLLHLTAPISAAGLALLILDHADPRLPSHAESIRVPAMSATTGEPMLVTAALLQLGTQVVSRHVPVESFALEEIQTRVLKVIVYKDEWPTPWAGFIQHPVKAVFEHHLMQHEAFPQTEHILDVWDRQSLDAKLARTQIGQAEVFAFLVRVTEKFADHLMPSAAVDGIYFEPRTMDGRKPAPQFHVIWMPRKTLAEVRFARSQTEAKTTIVRMGPRLGLRVSREHAEQAHKQHRPDLMFLDGQELRPYKVGPFPYGSTKASLSKGFKHLGWNARPVQPIAQMQVHEGIFWQVMAPQEPSHWIYQMKHGDILIAKIEDQREVPIPSYNNIIASKKTIANLTHTGQASGVDPWLTQDPWQSSKKSVQHTPQPSVTPVQLAALEQRLEQKIQATSADPKEEQMQVDQSARIEALEQQVHSLTQNFSSFQHQQQKVNHQISNQLQGFEGRIDAKLEDQMQRIESLLSKKMRHE